MATNTTTLVYDSTLGVYRVDINGKKGVSFVSQSDANTFKQRMDGLFSDPNRDLECITPSHNGSNYIIVCPLVRRNAGKYTYTTSAGHVSRQMYEPTYSNDSKNKDQTLLYVVGSANTAPWNDALVIANIIRSCVNVHFANAGGNSTCPPLKVPTNTSGTVASVIKSGSIAYAYYGDPDQGNSVNSNNKIYSFTTANGDILHPCDLTCALTSTGSWHTTYRNKFIKVTNLDNNKSIVLRATDQAPAGMGVEPTYRPHKILNLTSGQGKNIKLELMR